MRLYSVLLPAFLAVSVVALPVLDGMGKIEKRAPVAEASDNDVDTVTNVAYYGIKSKRAPEAEASDNDVDTVTNVAYYGIKSKRAPVAGEAVSDVDAVTTEAYYGI